MIKKGRLTTVGIKKLLRNIVRQVQQAIFYNPTLEMTADANGASVSRQVNNKAKAVS